MRAMLEKNQSVCQYSARLSVAAGENLQLTQIPEKYHSVYGR